MTRRKKKGHRDRYNGFKLGDNDRDRVVADWIDSQPNAAESIKQIIYQIATGTGYFHYGPPIMEEPNQPELDPDDPRVQVLANFET